MAVETDLGDVTNEVVIGWDDWGYVDEVEVVEGQDPKEMATVEAVRAEIEGEDHLNVRSGGADHGRIVGAKRALDLDPNGFNLPADRVFVEISDSRRGQASSLVHRKTEGGTINSGRTAQAGQVTLSAGRPPSNCTWLDTVDQTLVGRLLERLDREYTDQEQYLALAGRDRRYSLWLRLLDHHATCPLSASLPLRQEYEAGWSPAEAAAVAAATAGPALDTYIDLLTEHHGVEL
jgi:hypothetical protein